MTDLSNARRPVYLNPLDYKDEYCNICGAHLSEFYAFHSETPNRCGRCHSLERHRIFKWAYDWFIHREFRFEDKEVLACTPGDTEINYLLYGVRKLVSFDVRPVSWFDMQMDIHQMNQIADNSYDCFMAMAVLQHVRDDAQAIDEIHRVLRPGGRFFAQASNIMNGRTRTIEDVTRHYGEEELKKYGVGTYRVYGDTDLIRLVSRKLVVKTFHGFDPITGGTDFIVCGIKV